MLVKRNLDIETRKNLLSKPTWTYRDIMNYFTISQRYAAEIKKTAIDYHNGTVPFIKERVKTDSVFKALGISRDAEIGYLAKLTETTDTNNSPSCSAN